MISSLLGGGTPGKKNDADSVSMTTNETSTESAEEDSIKVCVRVRPHLRDERDDGCVWTWENSSIYSNILGHAPYTFDHLFYPEHTNEYIFDSVIKGVVLQAMQGYHGSVFTYGQTSSGKTFTMNGNAFQPGIIPQSIHYCFESIQSLFTDREFLFRVNYIEVYNEQVKDLLSTEPTPIKIQHDPKSGHTLITGVKEPVVVNPQQIISLLKAGEAHRHVGSTDMNEKSSRAHTLFKLIIESKKRGDGANAPVRVSNLNLVDLAGSENAKMTNSVGDRALEARFINQSLLTLSTIIQRLSEEKSAKHRQHLPYRDSKLTRLLQTSLSGNAQIALVCTISPTMRCFDETNNTLKFAARAKRIKMSAQVNEVMDDKTLLKVYKKEIDQLRARLAQLEKERQGVPEAPKTATLHVGTADQSGRSSVSAVEEEDEDENAMILQMISEMEKLILKADIVSPDGKGAGKDKDKDKDKSDKKARPNSFSTLVGSLRGLTTGSNSASASSPTAAPRPKLPSETTPSSSPSAAAGVSSSSPRPPTTAPSPTTPSDSSKSSGQQSRLSMIKKPGTMLGAAGKAFGFLSPHKTPDSRKNGIASSASKTTPKSASPLPGNTATKTSTSASSATKPSPLIGKSPSPATEPLTGLSRPPLKPAAERLSSPKSRIPSEQLSGKAESNKSVGSTSSVGSEKEVWRDVLSVSGEASKARVAIKDSIRFADDAEQFRSDSNDILDNDEVVQSGAEVEHFLEPSTNVLSGDFLQVPDITISVGDTLELPEVTPYRTTTLSRSPSKRFSAAIAEVTGAAHDLSPSHRDGNATTAAAAFGGGSSRLGADTGTSTSESGGVEGLDGDETGDPNRIQLSRKNSKRRFGFRPSLALSMTLSKVVEDTGEIEGVGVEELIRAAEAGDAMVSEIRARTRSRSSSNAALPPSREQQAIQTLESQEEGVLEDGDEEDSFQGQGVADDEDVDNGAEVLFGVKEMLSVLKQHVAKSSARKKAIGSHSGRITPVSGIDTPSGDNGELGRLLLDMKLITADNRFLQEELEKKDNMLALLTEGLREVEISQEEWLTENDNLSRELDNALRENEELAAELLRTRRLLEEREKLIEELTGVPSTLLSR